MQEILHKETKEEEKDILVAEVRIKNIQLSNKLKQLQDQVKQKEELEQVLCAALRCALRCAVLCSALLCSASALLCFALCCAVDGDSND